MHQASNATIFLTGKAFIADAKTKGDNLEFTTPSVEATIFENGSRDCAASGRKSGRDEQEKTQRIANGSAQGDDVFEREMATGKNTKFTTQKTRQTPR